MHEQYPDTDLPAYCRKCRESGGCGEACPRPTLLPENEVAARAYDVCKTQWQVGGGGATGLDYSACIAVLSLYLPGWKSEQPATDPLSLELPELMDSLRTIEHALLDAMAEKADTDRQKRNAEAADE